MSCTVKYMFNILLYGFRNMCFIDINTMDKGIIVELIQEQTYRRNTVYKDKIMG